MGLAGGTGVAAPCCFMTDRPESDVGDFGKEINYFSTYNRNIAFQTVGASLEY